VDYSFEIEFSWDQLRLHAKKVAPESTQSRQEMQARNTVWVCDIKVGVLPVLHDIFVRAYGGSSRVVWGARWLTGDRT